MDYRVTAHTSSGPRPTSYHGTAQEAFYEAIKLMTYGLTDIQIVDPTGRCFRPAEFVKELNGDRGLKPGRNL
jgi:hypothetical protein